MLHQLASAHVTSAGADSTLETRALGRPPYGPTPRSRSSSADVRLRSRTGPAREKNCRGAELPISHPAGAVMRIMALLIGLLTLTQPAAAHGLAPIQPATLWQAWSFDAKVLVPLLVAHWAYGRGVLRLWQRAGRWRGIGGMHVAAFLLGEIALVVALVSPVDQLGGTLLSAHMAQHGLLVAVAPPLLLLGLPGVAFAWALPDSLQTLHRLARLAVAHGICQCALAAPAGGCPARAGAVDLARARSVRRRARKPMDAHAGACLLLRHCAAVLARRHRRPLGARDRGGAGRSILHPCA